MKKNSIWIITWVLINILFSTINQYILTYPRVSPKSYGPLWGWDSSGIMVLVAGPILGILGALLFLIIDLFSFRNKIKNKKNLFLIRITLVILIVLLISFIEKNYF